MTLNEIIVTLNKTIKHCQKIIEENCRSISEFDNEVRKKIDNNENVEASYVMYARNYCLKQAEEYEKFATLNEEN